MARRPTVKDVAREAGVSVTTVDRALNGRMKVREDTLARIAAAAEKVGYFGKGVLQQRLAQNRPEVRLGFVFTKQAHNFYQDLVRELEAAAAARTDVRATLHFRFSKTQTPDEFASLLASLGTRCDAVAGTMVNDQRLSSVVEDLDAKGVPTFSMMNDFAQGQRKTYIGLNNLKVGRQAAWMITRDASSPGKLAVFVGGNRWHGHDLREVGFRAYVRDSAPEFTVLDTLVNLETRQLTYEATLDLLRRHPDLRGLYVAGGGMEGAIAAVREMHDRPHLSLVVQELTPDTRAGLLDGYLSMAIATPLGDLSREVVDQMVSALGYGTDQMQGQVFLEPRLVLPEIL